MMKRIKLLLACVFVWYMALQAIPNNAVGLELDHTECASVVEFLFYDGDRFFCSTDERGIELMETLETQLDVCALLEDHGYGPAPLPHEAERWAMDQLGLRYGTKVIGIVPSIEKMLVLELEGLATRPSGDGWVSGLLMRLRANEFTYRRGSPFGEEPRHRPIGICWPLAETRLGPLGVLAESQTVDEEIKHALGIRLEHIVAADRVIANIHRFGLSDSTEMYLVETSAADASVDLFALHENGDELEQIPFYYPHTKTSEFFLPIASGEPESDVAMYDTTYWVLPDLSGNGLPELFVQSTVSFLFVLERADHNYRWTLCKSYYRGP